MKNRTEMLSLTIIGEGGIFISIPEFDEIKVGEYLVFFNKKERLVGAIDKSMFFHKMKVDFKGTCNKDFRYISYEIKLGGTK